MGNMPAVAKDLREQDRGSHLRFNHRPKAAAVRREDGQQSTPLESEIGTLSCGGTPINHTLGKWRKENGLSCEPLISKGK